MYVIVPGRPVHHHDVTRKTHIWSTKTIPLTVNMSFQQRTAAVANYANGHGRGAVLSNNPWMLEDLCHKYGGVVQELRTGKVLGYYTCGHELYTNINLMDIRSIHNHGNVSFTNGIIKNMRVTHITDGIQNILFVSSLTDIPEVIELLGERVFTT